MRSWRWTFVIIIAGLLAQLAAFRFGPAPMNPDSPRYVELARSLLRDGTFRAHDLTAYGLPIKAFPEGPLMPETIRTPGYPLLLAFLFRCGGTVRMVALLQHAMLLGLAVLMHRRG